jgi:hypothetical protein
MVGAVGASTKKKKAKSRPAVRRQPPIAEPPPPVVATTAQGTLKWASRLVFAECVALAAVLAYLVYADASQDKTTTKAALLVTLYAAIFVLFLGLIARGLHNRRPWARGPAIALHLMLAPLGWYMVVGGLTVAGILMIVIGIGGFILLLLPATRAELDIK